MTRSQLGQTLGRFLAASFLLQLAVNSRLLSLKLHTTSLRFDIQEAGHTSAIIRFSLAPTTWLIAVLRVGIVL